MAEHFFLKSLMIHHFRAFDELSIERLGRVNLIVQSDIWSLVFEVAHRLNIQVFATTHSWDCLIAFQEAAKKYKQDEGVLVRLTQKEGRIIVDMFDEEDLEVVAREGIEVR